MLVVLALLLARCGCLLVVVAAGCCILAVICLVCMYFIICVVLVDLCWVVSLLFLALVSAGCDCFWLLVSVIAVVCLIGA